MNDAQVRRNRGFVALCIMEALSFWILIRPEIAYELIRNSINGELEMALQLSNTVIQTLIWLLISYVMIRYVQDTLYVERQYSYLGQLEQEISNIINVSAFKRESDHYLDNYPIVLNLVDLFYKMLMPIFFTVINVVRILKEWKVSNGVSIAFKCDFVLFIAISIITWFYFFEIHSKIATFCKTYIPFIDVAGQIIKKILKEV